MREPASGSFSEQALQNFSEAAKERNYKFTQRQLQQTFPFNFLNTKFPFCTSILKPDFISTCIINWCCIHLYCKLFFVHSLPQKGMDDPKNKAWRCFFKSVIVPQVHVTHWAKCFGPRSISLKVIFAPCLLSHFHAPLFELLLPNLQ